jgi:hypothetical protein
MAGRHQPWAMEVSDGAIHYKAKIHWRVTTSLASDDPSELEEMTEQQSVPAVPGQTLAQAQYFDRERKHSDDKLVALPLGYHGRFAFLSIATRRDRLRGCDVVRQPIRRAGRKGAARWMGNCSVSWQFRLLISNATEPRCAKRATPCQSSGLGSPLTNTDLAYLPRNMLLERPARTPYDVPTRWHIRCATSGEL